tara:strand:+ start:692 stop:1828 length:1137 start_codon:yes stop_codon:yes gene_type:complete
MEFKVKAVEAVEEKSSQQIEQELLNKHEEKFSDALETDGTTDNTVTLTDESNTTTDEATPVAEQNTETTSSEVTEDDVLKFIGKRYGKEINSLDEFNQTREENEPLPEDVSKYLKYKKDTGRGINDFYELQKDYDEVEPDKLLADYLSATEKGLDADDIQDLMEEYSFDEDLDDEKQIRKIKLSKKKIIAKAKDYFADQQEMYKVPLESRGTDIELPAEEEEEYKQYVANAKTVQERTKRNREVYLQKTSDVFDEFKGFEFELDGNKVLFSPGDAAELKKMHSNPVDFSKKYQAEDGTLTNAAGYHKSLAMAMQPDRFAKFFYEQGKSAAADESMRKMKNVNMTTRSAPETSSTKSGMQIKSVTPDHGRGLKIRSRKK